MNGSWFFDENFNALSDDFFDDVVKLFELPSEDVDPNDNVGEDWDASFQNLEPPPANVLAGFSSDFSGDFHKGNVGVNKGHSISCSGASELQQHSSTYEASSGRNDFIHKSTNGKDSRLLQTSSPVSVLESISSCSAENPTPLNPKLVFSVKRTRSKRRRPSTFNARLIFPLLSAFSSGDSHLLAASESESESHFAEKLAKKQKKKRNLAQLSGSTGSKKSLAEQPVAIRKCMHCEVTKTPQWREGPMGPKTLCNACGVRYRSGRLLPEYRPAASPTYVPSLHSNSHKKVIEMRKKFGNQPAVKHLVTLPKGENSSGSPPL